MNSLNAIANAERARSLLRQLLRIARQMPTPERRTVVHRRSLAEFRSNRTLTDPDAIAQAMLVAEVQIDNLTHQLHHLNQLHRDHVGGKQSLIVPVDVHVREEEGEQRVRKRPSAEAVEERQRRDKERQELRDKVRRRMRQTGNKE